MTVKYMCDLEKRHRMEQAATMYVRIYSYENRVARGVVMSMTDKTEIPFCGLDQMSLIIEELLDRHEAFDGTSDYRCIDSAFPCDRWLGHKVSSQMRGCPQKFLIRVHSRQNRSLHGELRTEGKGCYFRSGMELMRLMHQWLWLRYEALEKDGASIRSRRICNI